MYIRSKEEEIFRASLWQIWANLESLELRERRRRKVKTNSSKLRLKKQMINRGDRHRYTQNFDVYLSQSCSAPKTEPICKFPRLFPQTPRFFLKLLDYIHYTPIDLRSIKIGVNVHGTDHDSHL